MPFNDIMHDGDLRYRVEKLERRQREDNSGRRLENSSIGEGGLRLIDGGSIEIDGGELRLISEDGVELARWGRMVTGADASRGVRISYHGGGSAQTIQGAPEHQFYAVWDLDGNIVISTDGESRAGLGRPYLNYRMEASRESEVVTNGPFWPSVEGGSYTELFYGYNPIQHPRISFGIQTAAVSGDTEWRLLIDGTEITSGSGGAGGIYDIPGWGTDIQPVSMHRLSLEVRQSDSTRAWAQITRCYGHQS